MNVVSTYTYIYIHLVFQLQFYMDIYFSISNFLVPGVPGHTDFCFQPWAAHGGYKGEHAS